MAELVYAVDLKSAGHYDLKGSSPFSPTKIMIILQRVIFVIMKPMKKYKYILLDWDGNLAKTLDVWLDAIRVVLEDYGVTKTDEEIAASFGGFDEYMKKWGIANYEEAISKADFIVKQKLPEVELYPDALEVLENLHSNGHKLALITTSPHENVDHLLNKHSLSVFFDAVIAADDTTHHKPHPEPLELALHELGGVKETAVMVGDSDKDLGAAKNAGIDSILFYPKDHAKFYDLEKLQLLEPTYVVSDFREVIDIV